MHFKDELFPILIVILIIDILGARFKNNKNNKDDEFRYVRAGTNPAEIQGK